MPLCKLRETIEQLMSNANVLHFTMNLYYRNDTLLEFSEIFKIEKSIYSSQAISDETIPAQVILKDILERNPLIFYDKTYNLPQNIFLIRFYKGKILIGRKIRSDLHIQNKINAINCSKLTASMLLGILSCIKRWRESIEVYYHPLTKTEKLTVFKDIYTDRLVDIEFPFRYKDYKTKKEKTSPKTGWSINNNKAVYLGYGEEHIRRYTINHFQSTQLMNTRKVVFDPACSTGQFLYELKQNFPNCKTIGQDLSKDMVSYAKKYVDEIHHGDAIQPLVPEHSIDILILRFLNSEVVSTPMAYRLFTNLLKTIKNDGIIILFGHTPLLIRAKFFLKTSLKIIHANGYDNNTNSIFQYYILSRSKRDATLF